jgi:hypothetical protein
MRRRGLRWTLAGLAVILLAASVVVLRPQRSPVTPENFDLLKIGMTCTQVRAILGPPTDYRSGPTVVASIKQILGNWNWKWPDPAASYADSGRITINDGSDMRWEDDTSQIAVWFDRNETLAIAEYNITRRAKQSPFDNALWRVKRFWHRWFP